MNDVSLLWRKRVQAFWAAITPALRYMSRSGFLGMLFLAFIAFSYVYGKWLLSLPSDRSPALYALGFLILPLSYSPVRTFFVSADVLYLMPMEHRLKPYIRSAFLYNVSIQLVYTALFLLLFLPILRRVDAVPGLTPLSVVLLVAALKLLNVYGSWCEQQFLKLSVSMLYRIVRILYTATVLWLFCSRPSEAAADALLLFAAAAYIAALRMPERFPIHWSRLIEIEQTRRNRIYSFFNQFIDMPDLPASVKNRRWISWVVERLPIRPRNTYRYFYGKLFIRTSILGMLVRFIGFCMIIIIVLPHNSVKSVVYLLSVYLLGMQLSALRQQYKHSLWFHIYPVEESEREDGAAYWIRRAQLAGAVILYPVLFACVTDGGWRAGSAFAALLLTVVPLILPQQKAKTSKDE